MNDGDEKERAVVKVVDVNTFEDIGEEIVVTTVNLEIKPEDAGDEWYGFTDVDWSIQKI